MKRTLLATLDFPPMTGGVANYWGNLCKELPNDSLVVLAPDGINTIDYDVKQEYLIYRQRVLNKSKWFWPKWMPLFLSIHRLINTEKIEFLIAGQILPVGTIAYLLNKLFNLPYGISIHGLDLALTQVNSRKRWLTRKILASADWVLTNSEFTTKLLSRYYPDLKLITGIVFPCPNINLVPIPQVIKENLIKNNDLKDKKIVLTVGRLVERKGQDMIIKSLPIVIKTIPDTRYIIVGNGPDNDRLKQLTEQLKLNKYVIFFEKVADYELPAFYDLADIFAMPCRELADGDVEGFGIVYLEAGNFKKPVIAGRSGGAVEAVTHNDNGLIVDPKNENEVAQAIISLFQNTDKAKTLGERGFKRVQEKFNWSEQSKKLINLLS